MSTGLDEASVENTSADPLGAAAAAPSTPDSGAGQPAQTSALPSEPGLNEIERWLNTPQQINPSAPEAGQAPAMPQPGQAPQPDAVDTDAGTVMEWIKRHPLGQAAIAKWGTDEEAILHGLLNNQHALSRRDEDAAWGRAQQLAAAAQALQQQQPAAPPADPKKKWDAPKWDPAWVAQLSRDAEGNITGPPDVMRDVQAYQAYHQRKSMEFFADPEKVLGPILEERDKRAEEIAERVSQRVYEQARATEWAQSQRQRLQPYVYVNGDPNQGYTNEGRWFMHYCQEGRQLGYQPGPQLLAYVERAMNQTAAQAKAAVAEAALQQHQAKVIPATPARPNAHAAVNAPNQVRPPAAMGEIRDGEDVMGSIMRQFKEVGIRFDPALG